MSIAIFVEFIPMWYITQNIDVPTAVNHNKALLVSSIYTTYFGRANHSEVFKNTRLQNPKENAHINCLYKINQ
jgi:hypothetical protein